ASLLPPGLVQTLFESNLNPKHASARVGFWATARTGRGRTVEPARPRPGEPPLPPVPTDPSPSRLQADFFSGGPDGVWDVLHPAFAASPPLREWMARRIPSGGRPRLPRPYPHTPTLRSPPPPPAPTAAGRWDPWPRGASPNRRKSEAGSPRSGAAAPASASPARSGLRESRRHPNEVDHRRTGRA